jgi:transcriptional regulator with XRE-family HTH domain
MTQLQLAKAAGYTERLVRKAEKGGSLDITTIQNLAEAFSQFGAPVKCASLIQDNQTIARIWIEALNEYQSKMSSVIAPYLSDDLIINSPGCPQIAPFAGTFCGQVGHQKWLDAFFRVFDRVPCCDVEFSIGADSVVARWMETVTSQGTVCGQFRVSMFFRFRDGLIVGIDHDHDTRAAEDALTKARLHSSGDPKS